MIEKGGSARRRQAVPSPDREAVMPQTLPPAGSTQWWQLFTISLVVLLLLVLTAVLMLE